MNKEKPDLIISHRALTTKYLMVDAKINIPVISMFHDDPKNILETATTQVKKSLENSAYVQVFIAIWGRICKKILLES
mgnify:CR=1 FL=1